ncbi:MAG: co-chaperone GroES [Chloroflexi bacterium]|nr:co-chaperone GroES [Chloroflexota bacterium]
MADIIEPIGPRVLVRPIEQESRTSSGLYIPESAKEKPQKGEIMALGTADELVYGLAAGDLVLFEKYAGTQFQLDGTTYLLLDEGDVLARLRENGTT